MCYIVFSVSRPRTYGARGKNLAGGADMKHKRFTKKLELNKITVVNLLNKITGGAQNERCAETYVNQSCPFTMQPDTCIETCGFSFEYCTVGVNECPTI